MKRFVAALMLVCGLVAAGGVGATTIYQYSGTPSGAGGPLTSSNPAAIKITPSTNVTVTTVVVSLGSVGTPPYPLIVTICNDNGVGTAPSGTCPATFTTSTSSTPSSYTDVTYTGSYSATANTPFWIKFSTLSTGWTDFLSLQDTGQITVGSYSYDPTGPIWAPASDFVVTVSDIAAPTATTNAASSITRTGATLNGTVSANGASTTVTFEYGLTPGYGASGSPATASQSPLSSSASSASVSAAITGLTCNTQYHFRVNANNGTGGTINGSDATFTTSNCPPTVTSVSPATGTTAGGTAITITGSGFLTGATATVGGVTCSSLTVVSSTSIACTTGAHGAGAVDVVVTNTVTQRGTATGAFNYHNPAPTVTSVSPATGTTAGGTAITITGSGFLTGATAAVGGVTCSSLAVVSSTSIICTTGAHGAGAVDVVVTNPDTQTGTGIGAFTYQSTYVSGTTPGGTVSATVSGGTFLTAEFSPGPDQQRILFPYGLFGFTASTAVNGLITVTLTYPRAFETGTRVWKYHRGGLEDWTNLVTISGNTITYTIRDGGPGDADQSANGSVTDPLGPASPATSIPSPVPTLSEWAQLMLALMVIGIAWHFHNNRQNSY